MQLTTLSLHHTQHALLQIHGLTTAASIWLSASIGVAVGGGYFFISLYSVFLIVKVLKYGPRIFYQKDDTARYGSEVGHTWHCGRC
jgi:uncharacterized membrane protein YhiD involved in acid resistance